ncbi:glycosyltransferase [Myxosarcina sp. GI1]|uniref:glycosyltransferase n=1 Tax=Myxosarcina sp. GI1 TaxID=1541065 RepID=UPI00056A9BD7|nr:cellulose synthase catalytic subunit [Myxosarcina sp. GI1]
MTVNETKPRTIQPKMATVLSIAVVLIAAILALLWAAGLGAIDDIFAYLNLLQEQPPVWVEAPMVMGKFLLAPAIILFITVFVITKISDKPRTWSRVLLIVILLCLTIRYLLWRSLSTLNLSNPIDGTFSITLFALEMLMLFSSSLQLFLMLRFKNRQPEAERLSVQVKDGTFNPTVDILIPTYDEPEFILRRTVIGCQAINYERKKVYLLDDTQRPQVARLAKDLGCQYITRPNNAHAKAGNLNHALPLTRGEFIVVFDADFVPTQNFLHRTLGFFQDEKLALLQTPQSFYNTDPIARNLGLEDILTPEEEVFYRQLQPIKDGAGSVVCAGTSFVVRRQALESIGGFVTDSLSEDYFTGIRLSARGYRLAYLDEKLSAGLAAENISAHAMQRLRWARGTLQAFFIKSNPLTIPGLNPLQRLAHFEGLLHWFTSIATVFFLLMPLAYAFLNVIPIRATTDEFLYFFLPYYLTQITVFSWLNYRSRSAILSGIYSLVLAFPLAVTVVKVMLNPFSKGFKVTPKGTKSDRFSFNWNLAFPLIILFIFNALSFWSNLYACAISAIHNSFQLTEQMRGLNLGWIWSIYNLVTIGAALLILLDVPKPDLHEWFRLRRTVKLEVETPTGKQEYWGVTTLISEVGADISITQSGLTKLSKGETLPANILILEEKIAITGVITAVALGQDFLNVKILFEHLSVSEERKLIAILFCRPGQWKRRNTPGELRSLWLLLRILLRPRVLFGRNPEINGIHVSQI